MEKLEYDSRLHIDDNVLSEEDNQALNKITEYINKMHKYVEIENRRYGKIK